MSADLMMSAEYSLNTIIQILISHHVNLVMTEFY